MSIGSAESIKIGVETPGSEEAQKLADKLAELQGRIEQLTVVMMKGGAGFEAAVREQQALQVQAEMTAQALEHLAQAHQNAATAAQAGSGSGGNSNAGMTGSQAKFSQQFAALAAAQATAWADANDTYQLADATLHELANSYVVLAGSTKQFTDEELAAITATYGMTEAARQAAQESQHWGQVQTVNWTRSGSAAEQASSATQRFASKLNQSTRRGASGANMLAYKMGVIGATIDDLQYVGEMGLRPIINNLMMINPALGIAVIAFDQARKHLDELKAAGAGISEYWGLGDAADETDRLASAWKTVAGWIGTAAKSAGDFLAGLKEGWDFMSGGDMKAQRDAIQKFTAEPSRSDQGRGQSLKGAIGEFKRTEVLDQLVQQRATIDPALKATGKDGERARLAETEKIVGILDRAMKGDANALAEFEKRSQGTRVGDAYQRREATRTEDKDDLKRRKAAREKTEAAAAERNEAIDKKARDDQRAFDRRADETARGFEGRTGDRLLQNAIRSDTDPRKKSDEEMRVQETNRIRDRLIRTGQETDPEKAAALAQAIFARNLDATGKRLRQRVNEQDVSPQEAARSLLAESAAKQAKAGEDKVDAATKLARETIPSVAKQTERRLMAGELQGGDPETVAKALATQLKGVLEQSGLSADDAGLAADRLVDEARRKVEGDIAERRDNPKDEPERKSEVHAAADFSKTLLTARTGQDAQEKSVRLQERMVSELARQRELMENQARTPPVARLS